MTLSEFVDEARKHLPPSDREPKDTYTISLTILREGSTVKTDYNFYFEKEPREADGWRYVTHNPLHFYPTH